MDINEIINSERSGNEVISDLKRKSIVVPSWEKLRKEYEQKEHPVMDKAIYPDKTDKKGKIEKVTRYTLGLQKLAVKRMTELIFAIPVQRIYKPENEKESRAAEIMEEIFKKNRINSVNIERGNNLFASCENVTLWYSQEQEAIYAGEKSKLKLRCKNYSPKNGEALYPLFDEYDDLIALSVEYTRTEDDKTITYFDTFTDKWHIRWAKEGNKVVEEFREEIKIGKIAGLYIHRPTPIWEDESENVYEAEWTLSRQGNYIRKNARPNWVIFSDNKISHGKEKGGDNEGRSVIQYGKDDKAGYVTWQQAVDTVKFHVDEIKRNFFMSLQLPDMSMENMKATPMSGEARKMMFIDAQLKVEDESGIWLEFFDREVNVVRAFMKKMFPNLASAIDSLVVEISITPYQIRDTSEQINNLTNATGGKPIMSQKTAIRELGYVSDVDEELQQIKDEDTSNVFIEPTI